MLLADYLVMTGTTGNAAALLARFVPDGERTQGQWDALTEALVRSNVNPGSYAVPGPTQPTLQQQLSRQLSEDLSNTQASIMQQVSKSLAANQQVINQSLKDAQATSASQVNAVAGKVAYTPSTDGGYILRDLAGNAFTVAGGTQLQVGLNAKANLQEGRHVSSEYQAGVFRREWAIDNASKLTSLSAAFIGDIAVTPTGRYLLIGSAPTDPNQWFPLLSFLPVFSAATALTAGESAVIDDGTNSPKLVYKRSDGTSWSVTLAST